MTQVGIAGHAWLPRSPCGAGCVSSADLRVGHWRYLARWCAVLLAVVGALVLVLLRPLPRRARTGARRWIAGRLLRACGIGLRRTGSDSFAAPREAVLVAAQHVSWLDVLALQAVQPVSMVARADVAAWPIIGRTARSLHTVFLDRAKLRELPGAVAQVRQQLTAHRCVAVFPEGTTWCGNARGRLRPAFFQAAVDAGVPVRPVAVRYHRRDGGSTTAPAFLGDETLLACLRRILRLRGVVVELRLLPLQEPGGSRIDLVERCTAAVRAVDEANRPAPVDPEFSHHSEVPAA